MWVRKWLTYLTLFVAIAIVLGDLISLVYTFLNGEITTRFLFKVLAILLISGGVFTYYIDIIRGLTAPRGAYKRLMIISIIVVVASLVWGFAVMGSPVSQRKLQLDMRRVSDLQNMQSMVVNYWQTVGKLPATADEIRDPLSSFGSLPNDPETNKVYTYEMVGPTQFKLCATFSAASTDDQSQAQYYYGASDENWKHGSGETCFTRTIDPKRYPPIPSKTMRE